MQGLQGVGRARRGSPWARNEEALPSTTHPTQTHTPACTPTRDGHVEQHRLLPHQPNLLAQPAQVEVSDVAAVQQHLRRSRWRVCMCERMGVVGRAAGTDVGRAHASSQQPLQGRLRAGVGTLATHTDTHARTHIHTHTHARPPAPPADRKTARSAPRRWTCRCRSRPPAPQSCPGARAG